MNGKKQTTRSVVVRDPTSITAYLGRMIADADAIERRLLKAPLGLTGGKEPELWKAVTPVKSTLVAARAAWEEANNG